MGREVPNYAVPPQGKTIRITDMEGNLIPFSRKRVKAGKFRTVYRKITFPDQKTRAFELLDACFSILQQVRNMKEKLLSLLAF